MQTSVFLAKLMGPYFCVVCLGILINLNYYKEMIGGFIEDKALLYLGGAVALIAGIALVLKHNVWEMNWSVIITLIGWMAIVKGITILIFPNALAGMTREFSKNTGLLVFGILGMLFVGAALTVFGYFV